MSRATRNFRQPQGRSTRASAPGFTLIELLVVITILGVLSGIVVFSVRGTGDKGRDVARRTDARIMRTAEESYLAKFGQYGTENELVSERFLSEPSTLHDILLPPAALNGRFEIVCAAGTACSPPDAPIDGGTMIEAIPGPTSGSLNPAMTTDGGVHTNSEDMFNGLMRWSATDPSVVEPDLAADSAVSSDGKTVTFHLRPGVKWHDGTPLLAEDVKFSFERVLLKYHSRTKAALGPVLQLVDADNPTATVVFHLSHPYANLLRQLTVTEAPIIPKHVYEVCDNATDDIGTVDRCPANRTPVGTGPFKLDPATPITATEIRTVRNPDYFRAGLPHLAALVKRVVRVPDNAEESATSADIAALEAGTVDWVNNVPAEDLSRLSSNTTLRTVGAPRGSGGANCMTMLAFNLTLPGNTDGQAGLTPPPHPVLSKLPVRQAIAHAFNRPQAFLDIDGSQGRVADAPISSGIPFAHAAGLTLPTFDPVRAGQLLDAAGYPATDAEGTRNLTLRLNHLGNTYLDSYAEALTLALDDVGVTVDDVGDGQNSEDFTRDVFINRNFDLALVSYCNGEDPRAGVRRQYHSDSISPAAFTNASGYSNGQMDGLWDSAVTAPSEVAATAIYRQIQQKAIDDLPYLWFAETLNTRAHRGGCGGFNYFNTGLFAEAAYCRPKEG